MNFSEPSANRDRDDSLIEDDVPVTVQTVYKANGTESSYVIVANAVEDQRGDFHKASERFVAMIPLSTP